MKVINWHELGKQADALGVRVFMRTMDPKALIEEKQEMLDKVEAIQNLAEQEKREFTADEQAVWDSIMKLEKDDAGKVLVEKSGELAKIEAKIEAAEKLEADRKRIAHARRIEREANGTLDTTRDNSNQPAPRVFHRIAKLRCFTGDDGPREAYMTGMWLRAINARKQGADSRDKVAEKYLESIGVDIRMTQTESTGTAGGYLVPKPTAARIIDVREDVGITRRLVDVVPMSADTLKVPKRTGGLTVYAPGEGNTITASTSGYGQVPLAVIKRAVANQISAELNEDALVNMTDRAINEMAYALALQEDSEFIDGDGTSTYFGEVGLLSAVGSAGVATAATGHDTWPEVDVADVAAWFGLLPSKYWQRGRMAIICSTNFYHSVLVRLMMAGGGNTIAALQAGQGADAQFMGYPVFFSDRMPVATAAATISALFGNFFESTIFGDRTGVRMAMSLDFGFLDDVLTLKATSRYDINVHDAGDSSNAGAFVALKTAS